MRANLRFGVIELMIESNGNTTESSILVEALKSLRRLLHGVLLGEIEKTQYSNAQEHCLTPQDRADVIG